MTNVEHWKPPLLSEWWLLKMCVNVLNKKNDKNRHKKYWCQALFWLGQVFICMCQKINKKIMQKNQRHIPFIFHGSTAIHYKTETCVWLECALWYFSKMCRWFIHWELSNYTSTVMLEVTIRPFFQRPILCGFLTSLERVWPFLPPFIWDQILANRRGKKWEFSANASIF